jgi:hypothetical protein
LVFGLQTADTQFVPIRAIRGQKSEFRVPTSYICDNLRNLRIKRIGIERVGILPQITPMAQILIQFCWTTKHTKNTKAELEARVPSGATSAIGANDRE